MKLLFLSLLVIYSTLSYAQHPKYSSNIPKGYFVSETVWGDLNKDNIPDLATVLIEDKDGYYSQHAANFYSTEVSEHYNNQSLTRRLMIFFGTAQNSLIKAAQSDSILPELEQVGTEDILSPLTIKKGILYIELHAEVPIDKFTKTFLFRYQDNGFKLIGIDAFTGNDKYGHWFQYNLSTGKATSDTNFDDNTKEKNQKKSWNAKPDALPTLNNVNLLQYTSETETRLNKLSGKK